MSLRVLLTGFEAFPGAPYNPTPALIESLKRLRRPALADVAIATHVFPVTYIAVDSELGKGSHFRVFLPPARNVKTPALEAAS